jgi:hypothetical protein
VLIKLEHLEMTADGLRVSVLVPSGQQPSRPPVRKASGARVIETTGEEVSKVVRMPLRAAGGSR